MPGAVRVVTLVGNRPQFVKAAAVSAVLRERHEEVLVHSGQHYDRALSDVFFEELKLPAPDAELGVGSLPEGEQVARIMHALEPVVVASEPDVLLIYGDTNTTLAGALSSVRVRVPLAHVEAGMRSFDEAMPEERNRVIADHLSALCMCSTRAAAENLAKEEVQGEVAIVGDVMADVSLQTLPIARERSTALADLGVSAGDYLLATAHRPGNVDDAERLGRLVSIIEAVEGPVVFPVHPRTRGRLQRAGLLERLRTRSQLRLTEPLGYLDFMALLADARAVLTDSGGVQKEAYLARVPCITLRDRTEWTETVELGWNQLVDLDREAALQALGRLQGPAEHPDDLYGGGKAGAAVVAALEGWFGGAAA
jgi:UDP-GlcNAc3NAcA epimerase